MNRSEALERAQRGDQISELREVVFALQELQRARTSEGTPAWYLLNRLQRDAMAAADVEELAARSGAPRAAPWPTLRCRCGAYVRQGGLSCPYCGGAPP